MKKIATLVLIGTVLSLFSCQKDDDSDNASLTYRATDYSGAIAHEWMQLGYQMIKDNYLYGPHAARIYGYLGLTTWEAVYAGIPGARSLAGQINDYEEATLIDRSKVYDWGIVLCTAQKTVFPHLVDNISNAQRSQVEVLAALQEDQMMDKGTTEEVRQRSQELGLAIGNKIVERIRRDGRDVIRNIVPTIPVRDAEHPWYWDPNTFGQAPTEPMWGTVRTFATANSQACEIEPPFPYSTDPASDFYREALEVYQVEKNATNKAIAYHWENGPGRTCSPACHWISIAQQLLERENMNLAECAKTYALTGFAVSDAFSSSWFMKYKFFLLRPATYITETIDPNWTALVGTPPYPDYTSGSSTVGGAVPVVLSYIFGDIGFVDRTHVGSPLYTPDGGPFVLPERTFTSLSKAGEEQALSRILGGVHFRRACDLGLESGRCVGNTVLARLEFGF
ncbi:MAG: vanadium-dependent haloperoxidase [Saprospiraceae bacterium]|nr:vanadium-dependent haloperoxidase [Saprospiraceae bacterium]